MTRIKICGLTNAEDVRAAIAFGADAVGFIAVPESPRYLPPDEAHDLFAGIGPYTPIVTVARTAAAAAPYTDIRGPIQFYHGPYDRTRPSIRVFRIKDADSLAELADYKEPVDAIHLDTYQENALGGVGKAFDWSLAIAARSLARGRALILAGGLTPDNVAEAVALVRPYAVDVSSGVEAAPGRKDHAKLRAFINAVRKADLSL